MIYESQSRKWMDFLEIVTKGLVIKINLGPKIFTYIERKSRTSKAYFKLGSSNKNRLE